MMVYPNYFATMDLHLIAGRDFEERGSIDFDGPYGKSSAS